MAHLVGIDKSPVMDWTNDSGLDERYRKVEETHGSTIQRPTECSLRASQMQLCGPTGVEITEWT